jgi:hypothetical protein
MKLLLKITNTEELRKWQHENYEIAKEKISQEQYVYKNKSYRFFSLDNTWKYMMS